MTPGVTAPAESTIVILAAVAFTGALLMAGLLTAFFRVSGLYRNGLLDDGVLGRVLRDYLDAPRRFQVTVSTLYLLATILGSFAWGHILAGMWPGALTFRFYLLFAVTTLLAWTLGGLVVKLLAAGTGTAVGYARAVGTLIYPLYWLMRPWSALLLWVMDRLDDTLWTGAASLHLSADEIRSLIDESEESVTLDEDEREMIHSIFSFHDTVVREIMIPRIAMVVLEMNDTFDQAVSTVNEKRHSRIPVYAGSIDKVIGILYAKDLINLIEGDRLATEGKQLADLVRPAYFIPESKKIDEVLDEFRAQRIHMAVVIDEYGGTAGLVTLEDVLEEIVGEIADEFDDREQLYIWVDARTVRVDPKIDLEDLQELLGSPLPTEAGESSETLGGLIYEAAGSVPRRGDCVELGSLVVTIEEVADQRIVRALIRSEQPLPGYARRDDAV